jgi:hypothetical protein
MNTIYTSKSSEMQVPITISSSASGFSLSNLNKKDLGLLLFWGRTQAPKSKLDKLVKEKERERERKNGGGGGRQAWE